MGIMTNVIFTLLIISKQITIIYKRCQIAHLEQTILCQMAHIFSSSSAFDA